MKTAHWFAWFLLWSAQALIALAVFLSLPGGVSAARLLMTALLAGLAVCFAAAGILSWRGHPFIARLWEAAQLHVGAVTIFALLVLFFRFALAYVHMLLLAGGDTLIHAYVIQLNPLLNLLAALALETLALRWRSLPAPNPDWLKKFIAVMAVLSAASLWIYLSGWGVVPGYKGDWSRGIPAVAFLEWQIFLALAAGAVFAAWRPKSHAAVFFALWIFTALLWSSQPIQPGPAALSPREPNFEIYPFSDSQLYDSYAQSALVGQGYGAEVIPQRPLYVVLLTFFHLLVGQNYSQVILAQTLLFAFFPPLLYLLAAEWHDPSIGIALALLAALRDVTSNLSAPFTGNLSYSKLYLSELPTAMLLTLFLWLGTKWFKRGFSPDLAFWMGGALGAAVLIRTQAAVSLPALILLALLTRPRSWGNILKSAALAGLVVVLMMSPWLVRNWRMTGELLFDHPASQTANLALRYSRVVGNPTDISRHAGESDAAYNARLLAATRQAWDKNPRAITREIFSAFLNHGINNILLFPLRYDLEAPRELLVPTKAFWQQWRGELNPLQGALLVFYVFLFGLGISAAWHRLGWLGLLPLGVNLAYNLWTSLALLSGQRFMLTMDWSAALYYLLGVFALLGWLLSLLPSSRDWVSRWMANHPAPELESAAPRPTPLWRYLLAGGFFLALGASLWGAEFLFPRRYPLYEDALRHVEALSPCAARAVTEDALTLIQGRALYPRFYPAGEGESFTDAVGYKRVHQNRLVFELVGERDARIVLPLKEPADFFPHAADVTLGMDADGRVWFALAEAGAEQRVYFADFFTDCNKQ